MNKHNNSINYEFVHRLLPDYVQEEDRLLQRFLMTETIPDMFSVYMNILYKSCCSPEEYKAAKEKGWAESVFEITEEIFSEHISLVMVKMPEPKEWAEAKYLLFAFAPDDEYCRIRYFVCELGELEQENKEYEIVYFVCEWSKNRRHSNYGYLKDPSLENFVNRVKRILNKKWSAPIVTIRHNPSNPDSRH